MTRPMTDLLCIGSVLWDIIGRAPGPVPPGADLPGRITQIPGGVALNIAMTARRFGMRAALLSAVGRDRAGDALVAECAEMGLDCTHLYRSEDLPTDRYMAIEGAGGLVAAIADAHSLEAAGDKILAPLHDGTLGSAARPYAGLVALDGNLTESLLARIAADPAFAEADLRIAPASPGKAERLLPFLTGQRGTLYVNLIEAGLLCQADFPYAAAAARGLVARGARRALVTDGAALAADACAERLVTATPPAVLVSRVTGAGDTFMAAHMARDRAGAPRDAALSDALHAAARYVAGDTPT